MKASQTHFIIFLTRLLAASLSAKTEIPEVSEVYLFGAGLAMDGGSVVIEFIDAEATHWKLVCDRSIESRTEKKENFNQLSIFPWNRESEATNSVRILSEKEGEKLIETLKEKFLLLPHSADPRYEIIRDFLNNYQRPNQSR